MKKFLAMMILFISTLYCTAQSYYSVEYLKKGVMTVCPADSLTFIESGGSLTHFWNFNEIHNQAPTNWYVDCDWITPVLENSASYIPYVDDTSISAGYTLETLIHIRPLIYSFTPPESSESSITLLDYLNIPLNLESYDYFGYPGFSFHVDEIPNYFVEQDVIILFIEDYPPELELESEIITEISEIGDHYIRCVMFDSNSFEPLYNVEISKTITILDPTDIASSEVKSFSFYPNPATDILNLSEECDFKILDITGKTVLSGYSNSVNISNLSDGMYFVVSEKNAIEFIKQ